jgi:hypothetical protein
MVPSAGCTLATDRQWKSFLDKCSLRVYTTQLVTPCFCALPPSFPPASLPWFVKSVELFPQAEGEVVRPSRPRQGGQELSKNNLFLHERSQYVYENKRPLARKA